MAAMKTTLVSTASLMLAALSLTTGCVHGYRSVPPVALPDLRATTYYYGSAKAIDMETGKEFTIERDFDVEIIPFEQAGAPHVAEGPVDARFDGMMLSVQGKNDPTPHLYRADSVRRVGVTGISPGATAALWTVLGVISSIVVTSSVVAATSKNRIYTVD